MDQDKISYIRELDQTIMAQEHRLSEIQKQIRELQSIANNLKHKIDQGNAHIANLWEGAPVPSTRLPVIGMGDYVEITNEDFDHPF